jgi:hypothetical protein
MNLQPAQAVEAFATRNSEALSLLHRDFADAVPEAFAMLEPLHPEGLIHGGVLSAVVRDAFLAKLANRGMRAQTLIGTEGQFRSVRFSDGENWPLRVHMHPKSLKTGRYLGTTSTPAGLWEDAFVESMFELAVLWRPSRRTKALRSINLAAVANLDERSQTLIYASAPLPPVRMDSYWEPQVSEELFEPADDFDDLLPGDEETGDDWS